VSRILFQCNDLSYPAWEGKKDSDQNYSLVWDLKQLNWIVGSGDRIRFIYEDEEQKQAFWRLLLNKLKPKSGMLEIHSGVLIYSDEMLWDRARYDVGLEANLESKLFDSQPWLNQRRVSVLQLMDRIGLSGRALKIPLAELPKDEKIKAWLVMLMTAKVKVWLVGSLLKKTNGENLKCLKEWLAGFQGAWICFEPDFLEIKENSDHVMNSCVRLHRDGSFSDQTVCL
jgi:ATPase subunit of ABC transporter with duplicated ATPase domains